MSTSQTGILINLRVFVWATRKELLVWLRDPKVFGASLFGPLVLLLAFSAIATGRPVDIAVTDLDGSPASQRLVELLGAKDNPLGGKYFQVMPVGQEEGARLYYQRQSILVWLTIPKGFGDNMAAGRETTMQLALDNYHSDFAKNVRLYLNEAFVDLYDDAVPQVQFSIEQIHEAGVKISWLQSIAMGLTGLAIILAGLFNGFNGLLTEFQTETIKNLLLAPRSVVFVMLTKSFYALLGVILSGCLMLGTLRLMTGLSLAHGLAGFFLLAALAGLVYINLGMMIGLFVRRYMPAAACSMLFGVITWFLSGSLGELQLYTPTIRTIAAFLPITYMEEGLRGLLLYGDERVLWINAAYLALFLIFSSAALWTTARKKFVLA
jgi:ABC-2 type transport system permease protein